MKASHPSHKKIASMARKEREEERENLCNAIRFTAQRYVEAVNWTGYLKNYRKDHNFGSRHHTALENLYKGIGYQLLSTLVIMAGYDFTSDVEAAACSEVPELYIEAALEKCGFKKGKKGCRARKST